MRFSEPRLLATPARARIFCTRMGTRRSSPVWSLLIAGLARILEQLALLVHVGRGLLER